MKKKFFSLLLLFCFAVAMIGSNAYAADPIAVQLNGHTFHYDLAPYERNNNTMVPVRATFEALGAQVTWQQSEQTVTIQAKQDTVVLTIGSKDYLKNGQKESLNVPVELVNDSLTFAPVRLVSALYPFDIRYESDSNTVRLCTGSCDKKFYPKAPLLTIDKSKTYIATVKTNDGDFKIKLFADKAPITVNNFVFLARDHFYDNVTFHRIVKDFMIQTGDPTGTGTGGPGYTFQDELPPSIPYAPGVVAMANYGPNTNGSQFFIGSGNQVNFLNRAPNYTVFGQVTEGMDVIQKIATTPVTASNYGEVSKPTQDVHINSVQIDEQ